MLIRTSQGLIEYDVCSVFYRVVLEEAIISTERQIETAKVPSTNYLTHNTHMGTGRFGYCIMPARQVY